MTSLWDNIITPSRVPISSGTLQDFEKSLGFVLPTDYRSFILKYNGGKVNRPHSIELPGISYCLGVYCLLPLSDDNSFDSVAKCRESQRRNRFCVNYAIEIGDDMGVGRYYLILHGQERGSIFYLFDDDIRSCSSKEWNSHMMPLPTEMIKVCSTFDQLGALILEYPDGLAYN